MSQDRRNWLQRLFSGAVSPQMAADMESESRQWMVRCTYCGFERSVWDMGGVRYKAAGSSRQFMRCPNCGRLSWHLIYKRQDSGSTVALGGVPLADAPNTQGLNDPRLRLAEPGQRRVRWLLGCGGLLLLIILFCGGLFTFLNLVTQPVVNSGDVFMTALSNSDYETAYSLCSQSLQNELGSVAAFSSQMRVSPPTKWNWNSRSIRNDVGYLGGDLTFADGRSGSVNLVFDHVGSKWLVSGYNLTPN